MPEHAHADGYWFLELEPDYHPPEALQRWLDAGPPPVYVGFGSIGERSKAAETTALVVEAVKKAGMRGLLATGWSGMEARAETDPDICFIDAAPHEWLFPRMSVVVHHGGAGTTAAGLKAGIPTVVIPFGNDQFAWGRRVWELGVGARPIPRKRLTSDGLAAALLECQQEAIRQKAQALGARIREEKGVERAADVVEDCLRAHHSATG
jgi:sterol 3beta-glucosyltransferase